MVAITSVATPNLHSGTYCRYCVGAYKVFNYVFAEDYWRFYILAILHTETCFKTSAAPQVVELHDGIGTNAAVVYLDRRLKTKPILLHDAYSFLGTKGFRQVLSRHGYHFIFTSG